MSLGMFDIGVVCLVVTAVMAYVNHRFVGLPTTIGVMAIALLMSLGLIALDRLGFGALRDYEATLLSSIDFSELLMQGMLSLLLFAGALHIDLSQLRDHRWPVGLLAVLVAHRRRSRTAKRRGCPAGTGSGARR